MSPGIPAPPRKGELSESAAPRALPRRESHPGPADSQLDWTSGRTPARGLLLPREKPGPGDPGDLSTPGRGEAGLGRGADGQLGRGEGDSGKQQEGEQRDRAASRGEWRAAQLASGVEPGRG